MRGSRFRRDAKLAGESGGLRRLGVRRGAGRRVHGASFTTLELKTNLISTALKGVVRCDATLQHGGRTTQVWDATATAEATGRKIALFRCTQLILHPR